MTEPLDQYREKRDFAATPEPPDAVPEGRAGPLTFVVQKHDATRLHYDVRLEVGGVMKSWAVPRGPSSDPSVRRHAVMTEDHPIAYSAFEGVIPKGQYGAGQVIVWDAGTYAPEHERLYDFSSREEAEAAMEAAIEAGKISVQMRGRKLKGSWSFVKTSSDWLLLKHDDPVADPDQDLTALDRSVVSGLSLDDIRAGRLPRHRKAPSDYTPDALDGSRPAPLPDALTPMMASTRDPFSHPDWLFEPKLDGIRAVVHVTGGEARLPSRRGTDLTTTYPGLAEALAAQPVAAAIYDGEIVAFDERGVPSFEILQQRMNLAGELDIAAAEARVPVTYMAFDLLHLDGYDLTGVALEERKEALARVLLPAGPVALVEPLQAEGKEAYEGAVALGLEGVVAKRRGSRYLPGKRTDSWVKIKDRPTDEFVVCGFTPGEGFRAPTFGALLLGAPRDPGGAFVYWGRAGSGFTDALLVDLRARLDTLATDASPFRETPPEAAGATFVRPELVVEVEYSEVTSQGLLRAPAFKRLRPDKAPDEVVFVAETPAPTPSPPAAPSPASQAASVLRQLDDPRDELRLDVGGHEIPVTNLEKPLWPEHETQRAVTKRDLLRYLATVAPLMLPHLRNRLITLTRYPNGIGDLHFYQKHSEAPPPEYVETVPVHSEGAGGDRDFLLCNNLPTLLWLGQLANLEFHATMARVSPDPDAPTLPTTFTASRENIEASVLNYPDFLLFDLDPYIYRGDEAAGEEPQLNRKAFAKTVEVARAFKEILDAAALPSYVKTSGATGLHIYVPVLRQFPYPVIRSLCETVSGELLARMPQDVTLEWASQKRTGKIFLDVNQNARAKNVAAIFSPRAKPGAPVSVPVRWDELDDLYPTDFTVLTAPDRFAKTGDFWAGILDARQDLTALLGLEA
ncbi:MAG: non-homologous end-joining DNA ligase [Chloroflexi bacterium]|nr:non-homologous end-joining DNA ligase [Chloroflexota bacterium]